MKFFCFFFSFLFLNQVFSQNKNSIDFEVVRQKVSKIYFKKPGKALNDAFLLKKLAKTNEEVITAYQYLGYIYDLTGVSDSARFYLNKRLFLSKNFFSKSEIYYQSVIDYSNWGIQYVDSNELTSLLTNVLSEIDEEKFSQQKGLMFLLLGDVFMKDFDYEKAEHYYDKSFDLITGKYVKVDYYYRKGDVNIYRLNYPKAKENLNKGIEALNDKGIFSYILFLNKLGYVNLMLNDYVAAKNSLNESIFLQEKNGFYNFSSETYLYLYYLTKKTKKNSEEEKAYLDKALSFNNGNIVVLKDVYLGYKEFYSNKGDLNKEAEYFNKFKKLSDSVFSIEKIKVKTNIESKYQLDENRKELELKEKIIQKDKSIIALYLVGVSLLVILIVVLIILYFNKIKNQKKIRQNQKLLHEEELKLMLENQRIEIIKEKISAKTEEREKLSLELHDGIANEISVLKLSLATESNLNKTEIDVLVQRIDKLYSEIRNLSHNLDPDNISDIEFSQFVENLCSSIEKNGLKTTQKLYITRNIDDLEIEILVSIYRIIQEIVNNILKHAQATEVAFDLVESENILYIHIKDNGIGFDVKENKQGIGLRNIKKRVDSFGGNLQIISQKKSGTEFKINLPVKINTPENRY